MSQPWALNRLAKEKGISVKALLRQACKDNLTQREAAASLNLTVHGFNFACQRNGITWDHSRVFDHGGINDTMAGHCARLGIDPRRAYLYRHRKACSKSEALSDLAAMRQEVAA